VAAPDACFTCGTPAEPGQEYCLQCGERIVPARRFSAVGRAWERRFGRYPGDWLLASLLLLLVAAGSATAGIVASRDTNKSGGGSETIVATSPIVRAPPVVLAPTTVSTTPATPTTPKPTTTLPAGKPTAALSAWPARNGFTVVLASIPARGRGLEDANATAKAALAGGLRDVGLLVSSNFASLHPGYYVVFAGVYGSLEEAQTATARVAARFPNAYAREITH
jgi:hypothetical protein